MILFLVILIIQSTYAKDELIPPLCKEYLQTTCPIGIECTSETPKGGLTKINDKISKKNWIDEKISGLKNLRSFELSTYKPLYRHLAFEDPITPEIDKQLKKINSDYELLYETSREIEITRKKIDFLQNMKIGYIAPDLFEKYKYLQNIKIGILSRTPILAGEKLEELIKKSVEKDKKFSADDFKKYLIDDMQVYLLAQSNTGYRYENFLADSDKKITKDILEDIFQSGMADQDLTDKSKAPIACTFYKKLTDERLANERRQMIIDTSLFVAPFLLGNVGTFTRTLNLSKLLSWGAIFSPRTTTLIPMLMTLAVDANETIKLDEKCKNEYSNYGIAPSLNLYSELKDCRENLDSQIILSSIAIGAIGGAPILKTLSPRLRTLLANEVESSHEQNKIMTMLSKDFAIGNQKLLLNEIAAMKADVKKNSLKFEKYSNKIIHKEADVVNVFQTKGLNNEIAGYKVISGDNVANIQKSIGKETIEFLYIPGANAPYLPDAINKVGHVAMRIGDKVYHQTGGSGFVIESFEDFLKVRKKDSKVFGHILQVSPREQEIMKEYFIKAQEKQLPYSFLLNNCSQAACNALALAHVAKLPKLTTHDPVLSTALIKRSERLVMKTLYNADKDLPAESLKIATGLNRTTFYGAQLVATTGTTYAGVEAVDLIIDYINEMRAGE